MIGFHTSKGKFASVNDALDGLNASLAGEDKFFRVCQIFTHVPRNGRRVRDVDCARLLEQCERVFVHSTYLTTLSDKSVPHTLDQLEMCARLGDAGLVVHIPKKPPADVVAGVAKVVRAYEETHGAGTCPPVLLEMKAVRPDDDPDLARNKTYESPAKIAHLVALLERVPCLARVRVCIDTAHIYSGKMRIRTRAEAQAYLDALEPVADRVGLLHLNGNEFDCDEKARDKHALPFGDKDKVWRGVPYAASGLAAFVEWFAARDKPIICEMRTYADIVALFRTLKDNGAFDLGPAADHDQGPAED